MEKKGFDWTEAITCYEDDGKLRIVKGHHRLNEARKLGISVCYMVTDKPDESIYDLERTTRPWICADFSKSYEQSGNPEYVELYDFHRVTGIPLMVCANILIGNVGNTGNANEYVKSGTFSIKDRTFAHRIASVVMAAREMRLKFATCRPFVHALSQVLRVDQVSCDDLIRRIRAYPTTIRPCTNSADFVEEIEALLNRHMREDQRINLRGEVAKVMAKRQHSFGDRKAKGGENS